MELKIRLSWLMVFKKSLRNVLAGDEVRWSSAREVKRVAVRFAVLQ